MVDIKRLKQLCDEYDKTNLKAEIDYKANRDRLCRLVDKYDFESVAIATGLIISTVKQHYRNHTGTSMISVKRLDRAESILRKL